MLLLAVSGENVGGGDQYPDLVARPRVPVPGRSLSPEGHPSGSHIRSRTRPSDNRTRSQIRPANSRPSPSDCRRRAGRSGTSPRAWWRRLSLHWQTHGFLCRLPRVQPQAAGTPRARQKHAATEPAERRAFHVLVSWLPFEHGIGLNCRCLVHRFATNCSWIADRANLAADRVRICGSLPHAANGIPFVSGARAAPLAPAGLPVFSISSRNGLMMSIGIGKMMVEFCSAPISVSVCR